MSSNIKSLSSIRLTNQVWLGSGLGSGSGSSLAQLDKLLSKPAWLNYTPTTWNIVISGEVILPKEVC